MTDSLPADEKTLRCSLMTKGNLGLNHLVKLGCPKSVPCAMKNAHTEVKSRSQGLSQSKGRRNKLLEIRLAVEKNDDAMQVRRQGRSIGLRVNFRPREGFIEMTAG